MPRTAHSPITRVRINPEEKAELEQLAREAGVTLSEACRNGARLYLEALTAPRSRRGVTLVGHRRHAA